MKKTVDTFFEQLELGDCRQHDTATIFPLFSQIEPVVEYLTLSEAYAQEAISVRETSESGSVPELLVINRADQPVLILDGEEILGAKQNRTLNTTILLGKKSETIIPVSCTEQGRWAYGGYGKPGEPPEMMESEAILERKTRSRRMSSVHANLKHTEQFKSNQGEVWESISNLEAKAGHHSPTSSLNALYKAQKHKLDVFLNAFRAEDGQRGLLVVLGDRVSGFDYVSRPAAYRHLHDKLIRSYLLDLLLEPKKNQDKIAKSTAGKLVGEFLEQCRATKMQTFDSVGLGTNCRFEEDFIAGTKLVHEEEPIHSAFLTLDSPHHPDSRPSMDDSMASLRRRRRYRNPD